MFSMQWTHDKRRGLKSSLQSRASDIDKHRGNLLSAREVQSSVWCPWIKICLRMYFVRIRDVTWNLTEYVKGLKNDLKTWRRVFWRLWSQTHFLECSSCNLPFAVAHLEGCRYHTEWAVYGLGTRTKSASLPIGKFPCCQQVAYRFSLVPSHNVCFHFPYLHALMCCQYPF